MPGVFSPDEWTRTLRGRLQRRSKLVRAMTRAKNELHAVLARNLKGRPSKVGVIRRLPPALSALLVRGLYRGLASLNHAASK